MTQEQFENSYAGKCGVPPYVNARDWLRDDCSLEAIACDCGDPGCVGWRMMAIRGAWGRGARVHSPDLEEAIEDVKPWPAQRRVNCSEGTPRSCFWSDRRFSIGTSNSKGVWSWTWSNNSAERCSISASTSSSPGGGARISATMPNSSMLAWVAVLEDVAVVKQTG